MRSRSRSFITGLALLAAGLLAAGCGGGVSPANKPIPAETLALMKKKGLKTNAPVFMRIFKRESELEIWKQRDDGRFALLKTYPICAWSGDIGPKTKQGDKQAPEGFYTVAPYQMNPRSNFHLSFNLGYPNALDRTYNRSGDYLMVHGNCSSAGCYAMTDALIEEIYAVAREALQGGQKSFQVQALPFRMNDANMRRYLAQHKRWTNFWTDLKKGYDAFEMTHIPPKIDVCERRYMVNVAFADPTRKIGAKDPCPPYKAFVPDIIETPEGPRVVEAEIGSVTPYQDTASNSPAMTGATPQNADSMLVGSRTAPVSTRELAIRNTIALPH